MSTAGSVRSDEPAPFALRGADLPPVDGGSGSGSGGPKGRPRLFRWRGIFALIFGVALGLWCRRRTPLATAAIRAPGG